MATAEIYVPANKWVHLGIQIVGYAARVLTVPLESGDIYRRQVESLGGGWRDCEAASAVPEFFGPLIRSFFSTPRPCSLEEHKNPSADSTCEFVTE